MSDHHHGVQLKRFEKVVQTILTSVEPEYVCLPQCHHNNSKDWPFDVIPPTARVWGNQPGQLKKKNRAERKEAQIRSLLRCIMKLAPQYEACTIVDFGGGSGHLGLPLALMLPKATVCVVDLNKKSLDLMHDKAGKAVQEILQNPEYASRFAKTQDSHQQISESMKCCGRDGVLMNLFSWHGPVDTFQEPFDIAIALHLCGEASDVALRRAGEANAMGIVVAPCCVGKLSTRVMNPDVYHATGSNEATITYPQSSLFCKLISNQDDWDKLAKAADYSNELEIQTDQNALRRTAKALLETDRRLFLEERYQYKTAMLKMEPLEATPKNDIIVAWKPNRIQMDDTLFCEPDLECTKDIERTRNQLEPQERASISAAGSTNWSKDEEKEISAMIMEFLEKTKGTEEEFKTFTFPTQMGGRKRKLVHYVATTMDLAHWSVGSKSVDKTVAIARRRKRSRSE